MPGGSDALLRAEGLAFRYAGASVTTLRDLSFALHRGEWLGLAGASGSGKTTLLRLCAGLHPVEPLGAVDGQVTFRAAGGEHLDVLAGPARALRAYRRDAVAHLSETPVAGLHPHRRLVGTARQLGVRVEDLAALMERLGLDAGVFLRRYPRELSGGEAQRVRLAFALARRPRLLLLENPTSALDPPTARRIVSAVRRFRENGNSVLHVDHDARLLSALADRQLRLAYGQLREGPAGSAVRPATAALADDDATGPVAARVSALEVTYPGQGRPAVRVAELVLHAGECVAVLGRSGSGKSSLGRALAGLIDAEGTVELAGKRPYRLAERGAPYLDVEPCIQYVWQEPRASLNPALSVGQTLRLAARHPNLAHPPTPEELLASVGLASELLDRSVLELSTGQMQRLCLARAIAPGPSVLVCDEVTAALDSVARAAVLATLDNLRRDRGLALIFVTHDVDLARQVSHRTMVLDGGSVVESGPTPEVLAHPGSEAARALVEARLAV